MFFLCNFGELLQPMINKQYNNSISELFLNPLKMSMLPISHKHSPLLFNKTVQVNKVKKVVKNYLIKR